jgi:hypothetical protein
MGSKPFISDENTKEDWKNKKAACLTENVQWNLWEDGYNFMESVEMY